MSATQTPRHPTLIECDAAGRGPGYIDVVGFQEGGLPDTLAERKRFKAYVRAKGWDVGRYDAAISRFDSSFVRSLYCIWRDRGSLPTVFVEVTS